MTTALSMVSIFMRSALIVLLASAFGIASISAQGGPEVNVKNTDNWGQYFANVNGASASILFDDGLSDSIDRAKQTHALKIEIKLRDVRDDGFPARDEWARLNPLIDEIEAIINDADGLILGHATYSGHRWILAIVHADDDKLLQSDIDQIAKTRGYSVSIVYEPDPKKSVYWSDLYPDTDSRRVMNDGLVLENLAKHGDNPEAVRLVDHWTYFDDKASAEKFSEYLVSKGYLNVEIIREKNGMFSKPSWLVRSQHEGTMLLNDITSHTLNHDREARSLGGEYDGWETFVMKVKTD